ncbi:hypothetical protein [Gloeobacter kilaueensis]|uniref:Uncharacterized protein n=1 Tax=Gloeobacter kilaueensis (strain ATCC BAA-2537 / CCAP 1431/1 / ULC 316 / JS1) TaxID=1183438 RepID=U5QH77_GLOK1|nr:hypothetical protein [Gloeobacter kilaueensis]AGY56974.1 hypothetical protein GKIL_0728 [Gloeobacter kilaueensis JS1]
MRKLVKFMLAVLLIFGWNAAAFAETYTYQLAKVQFTVPNDFKKSQSGDALTIATPDRGLSMVFDSVAGEDLATAVKVLNERAAQMVGNLKFKNPPRNVTINGLAGQTLTGTGVLKNIPVVVNYTALKTPAGRVLLVISLVNAKAAETEAPVLKKILSSIKAA